MRTSTKIFLKRAWAVAMLPVCAYVVLTRPPAEPPLPEFDWHQFNRDTCLRCQAGITAPHDWG